MKDFNEILRTVIESIQNEAEGCSDCAFEDKEEWEVPCSECRRNCKDYWRRKNEAND